MHNKTIVTLTFWWNKQKKSNIKSENFQENNWKDLITKILKQYQHINYLSIEKITFKILRYFLTDKSFLNRHVQQWMIVLPHNINGKWYNSFVYLFDLFYWLIPRISWGCPKGFREEGMGAIEHHFYFICLSYIKCDTTMMNTCFVMCVEVVLGQFR